MDVVGDRDKCRAREESHRRQLAHTSLSVCPDCRGVARDWLTEVLNQPVSQFTSYCSICQTHISAAGMSHYVSFSLFSPQYGGRLFSTSEGEGNCEKKEEFTPKIKMMYVVTGGRSQMFLVLPE